MPRIAQDHRTRAARFFQGYPHREHVERATPKKQSECPVHPQGRTSPRSDVRIERRPDAATAPCAFVPVHDLLARYIVFSKAELEMPGDALVGIGVSARAVRGDRGLLGAPPRKGASFTENGAFALRPVASPPLRAWLPQAAPDAWTARNRRSRYPSGAGWHPNRRQLR